MLSISSGTSAAEPPPASRPPRLDPAKLLEYRRETGNIMPVTNVEEWQLRRASVLAGMQEVMGPWPGNEKRCPLAMETLEEVDCGDYVRKLITYRPEPKGIVPAYLLIPKEALSSSKKFPAVLCLHQTDNKLGHKIVVGLGNRPNDEYGVDLAKRGFVCLAPAYPLLANYKPDLKALGYHSGTMKAIWDNIRGMDLLESLPFVKPGKFGAIGHSLGGHNSIYTAVFDERIKVIVSSCGFDSFRDYMDGNIKGWTSDRYMPKLLNYPLREIPFDFHELIGALAPRPVFVSAPFYDTNFKWTSVLLIEEAASKVYDLYGARANLRVEHPKCGHEFPIEMREIAYRLFAEQLR
ncbi:MAG: alpha/beta hydrolase [Verrucomicrobia bacterium]|nr:alpha/beta hydrolase [Verrucomicrobiota bacterium]